MVDEIFNEDMFRTMGRDQTNTIPKVNVTENKDGFYLEVAAPGLKKEDFHINLDKNLLTIKASKETREEDKEEGRVTRREFNYTSFERSFTLPKSAEITAIEAKYENGILELTVPKKEEAKELPARQIEIK
jgi:HSP20 family protein